MKTKKIAIILITLLIAVATCHSQTLAVEGKPELTIDTVKTTFEPGEEFIASVKFSDNGSTQCSGFEFGLRYDKNVLEVVNSNLTIEKGAAVLNDKTLGSVNFVLISVTPVQYTGELFNVTFRVKQDSGGGESALRILSDNSDFPIENENGGVETTINAAGINIKAPIKSKSSGGFEIINSEPQVTNENIINNNTIEEKKDNIKELETSNIMQEDEEIFENEENTSNTLKKEQIGLPRTTVIIILVISAVGILTIFLMLKKNKK